MDCEIIIITNDAIYPNKSSKIHRMVANQLLTIGCKISYAQIIPSDLVNISNAIKLAAGRSRFLCVIGGLGELPWAQTVDAVCELITQEPILEQSQIAQLLLKSHTIKNDILSKFQYIRIPNGAEAIVNPMGIFPGFSLSIGTTKCFFLPSGAKECIAMMKNFVLPKIQELQPNLQQTKIYRFFKVAPRKIQTKILSLFSNEEIKNIFCRYEVLGKETILYFSLKKSAFENNNPFDLLWQLFTTSFGDNFYGTGQDSLLQRVVNKLSLRRETIAVAESCTGGKLGSYLSSIPGASAFFQGGIIAYQDDIKMRLLDVPKEILHTDGAVSQKCVEYMANSVKKQFHSTYGLAISGWAGPTSIVSQAVGTVCFAWADERLTFSQTVVFKGSRNRIIQLAVQHALFIILSRGV